jgi:hypothetical protein
MQIGPDKNPADRPLVPASALNFRVFVRCDIDLDQRRRDVSRL